jgi:ABC-type glycerol-3-phosphate transport system substrate-binding protein
MDHANPMWAPPIPEFRRIREQIAIAIDYVLSGQKSSEDAMKEANKATYDILKEAGYLK